jgi:two-component system chemotaxis response regulator CheB
MFVAPPPTSAVSTAPIRVIVVDDSLVIRGFITRALEGDVAFKVVGTASNGALAVETLQRHPADVVILDIEMPVMDGLTAIPKLKAIDPATQIMMASTLTQKNGEISLKALALGATDYIAKPSAQEMSVRGDFQRDLRERVKTLAAIALRKRARTAVPGKAELPLTEKKKISLRPMPLHFTPKIIAIGSSTGGPQALFEVIKAMGNSLPQPIVITQHMPPSFTTILADHITRQCGVTCVEASEGEILRPGVYYIAPGDFHFLLTRKANGAATRLVKEPQENFCRPAVDPMLRSLVELYGGHILAVILTGMGQDGCKGCDAVVNAGGCVIAQDEATSIVWGMPGAVATAGLCGAVLPLAEIGSAVHRVATSGQGGVRI